MIDNNFFNYYLFSSKHCQDLISYILDYISVIINIAYNEMFILNFTFNLKSNTLTTFIWLLLVTIVQIIIINLVVLTNFFDNLYVTRLNSNQPYNSSKQLLAIYSLSFNYFSKISGLAITNVRKIVKGFLLIIFHIRSFRILNSNQYYM